MRYPEFLAELQQSADVAYRDFHKRLLKNDEIKVLGVRVPQMRKIAKKYAGNVEELMLFPDEYYEVTFIKLTAVSYLGYDSFLKYIDACVPLIDNWATCDCFTPKCIEKHREEFLPRILAYLSVDKEFYRRFALTTLLHYYVEEKYLPVLTDAIMKADAGKYYYVHMAAAWLLAEMLVKHYGYTVRFLEKNLTENKVDAKTHNKAIQKACESFRLSDAQKKYLKEIKK